MAAITARPPIASSPGADHAAVQAAVAVVADQLFAHRYVAADAVARDRVDAQAEHAVEDDALLEDLAQPFDELGLEGGAHQRGLAIRCFARAW